MNCIGICSSTFTESVLSSSTPDGSSVSTRVPLVGHFKFLLISYPITAKSKIKYSSTCMCECFRYSFEREKLLCRKKRKLAVCHVCLNKFGKLHRRKVSIGMKPAVQRKVNRRPRRYFESPRCTSLCGWKTEIDSDTFLVSLSPCPAQH